MSNPTEFPKKSFFIEGPVGKIECLAGYPSSDEPRQSIGIICHPHPLFGGTMHNKVTHIIEKAFREMGLHTIRFNFRGVGESQGEFDDGVGESEDLIAITQWAKEIFPDHTIWLAGFSFGSYVALRACDSIDPEQFLTVAPPVERYDYTQIETPTCPWLVIQGEEDDVVKPLAVYEYVNNLSNRPQLITFKAGHFFHRRLLDLKGAVINGITRQMIESSDTENE